LKIRHWAIVDNIVTSLYAKFDDRLWNEKALVDRQSDNNNNIYSHWGPVSGSKNKNSKA